MGWTQPFLEKGCGLTKFNPPIKEKGFKPLKPYPRLYIVLVFLFVGSVARGVYPAPSFALVRGSLPRPNFGIIYLIYLAEIKVLAEGEVLILYSKMGLKIELTPFSF